MRVGDGERLRMRGRLTLDLPGEGKPGQLGRGRVPLGQDRATLVRPEQVQCGDRQVRRGQGRAKQPFEPPYQHLGGIPVEQIGGVFEPAHETFGSRCAE